MSLKGLFDALERNHAYRRLVDSLASDPRPQDTWVLEAAKPFLLAALWHGLAEPILAITARPEDARRLHGELVTYLGESESVYLLPEPEVLPFERLASDGATNHQRLLALSALEPTNDLSQPPLVVASVAAVLRKTMPPEVFHACRHTLKVGQRVRVGQLLSRWVELGYRREEGVEIPGSFCLRGGILDIYSPSSSLPARIELVGDEIESIRFFNRINQRSVASVDSITVIPAGEALPALVDRDVVSQLIGNLNLTDCTTSTRDRIEEELVTIFSGQWVEELSFYNGLLNQGCLLDYLSSNGVVVFDSKEDVEAYGQELFERTEQLRTSRVRRGELPANFPSPQLSWSEFWPRVEGRRRLTLQKGAGGQGEVEFRTTPLYYGRMERFAQETRRESAQGTKVVVVSRHAKRVAEILEDAGVGATVTDDLDAVPRQGSVTLIADSLKGGWSLATEGRDTTLLTDAELFGVTKERPYRPRTAVRGATTISQLVPGGYVVHVDHGVARFASTTKMEANGEQQEYLVLEYAQGDRLYVPTDHLDRVSSYLAPNDQAPSLTRLGTQEWVRAKERARASTREMAQELLQLYASRQLVQGHSFSPDSAWQRELADSFPYEETEDQRRTIDEVKREMEQPRPMDRLVCGDVGYGKTEVALRAAFKAVEDGMQVAILVPTTVLAQQHYATFTERLAPFPVRVEVLSRFRSPKEQDDVVERLQLGTVDVVVGTHRLLQKDVKFKNLGLVIVDEEQRFGVTHKERLKRLRSEVDMLTLSATPIPRTLYMALSGIRDMSTMETPPEERLPVKTYLSEYSDEVVKEAILREMERGGQVFFLHNRVHSIGRITENLRKLVPHATIAVGHGQMREADLEEVMARFAQGEMDVLVCTTIIESGLDIPNANTLIIDRADRFGLSQLYQLRGRVGRAHHRAYSYLLTPPRRRITEAAGKRLAAILEASELGAGFRIAMRDLEIRGAGNILGAEQSGHIHAVGFELYAQLLNDAMAELQPSDGAALSTHFQPKAQTRVNLPLVAHIPDTYVSHLPARLDIYQRLAKAQARSQVDEVLEELRDRFGPLPDPVTNLLYVAGIRVVASQAGIESIVWGDSAIVIALLNPVGGASLALEKTLGPRARVGNRQIQVSHRQVSRSWQEELVAVLERLAQFQARLENAEMNVGVVP